MLDTVLKWNNTWRFDYWYRERYNIPFASEAHRKISQIDIKFDWVEKKIAEQQREQYEQIQKDEEAIKKGASWLRRNEKQKEKESKLIDSIDFKSFS